MPAASQASIDSRLRTSVVGRELVLLTWAETGDSPAPEAAAEEAYAAIAEALRERGAQPVQERVFGELAAAPAFLCGRARVVGSDAAWAVPPTYVEGAPAGRGGLAGIHVIGARGSGRLVSEGGAVFGRSVEGESACLVGLSDVGRGAASVRAARPSDDAASAIARGAALLEREGFSFHDVARTWFYLRDILEWYGPFNTTRNAAFRRMGLASPNGAGRIPASTGIAGRSLSGGWCALDLLAVRPRPAGRVELRRLHSRRQNEATEYGSAFARAMQLELGDARYLFVSGTAAIDDHGSSVHPGDFAAQARHTLDAVEALLSGAGAGFADVAQATAFLKQPGDRGAFERIVAARRLGAVPLVTTVADVCRSELLFELDATAVVPRERTVR